MTIFQFLVDYILPFIYEATPEQIANFQDIFAFSVSLAICFFFVYLPSLLLSKWARKWGRK